MQGINAGSHSEFFSADVSPAADAGRCVVEGAGLGFDRIDQFRLGFQPLAGLTTKTLGMAAKVVTPVKSFTVS